MTHGATCEETPKKNRHVRIASRLYWEYKGGFFDAKEVSIPVAVTVFPGEQYQAPRSWAEQAYPNLIYFNEDAARQESYGSIERFSGRNRKVEACY
jgi:hypothetical protein